MLGAKIGNRGEISTVSNITPELLTIKDEAFVAEMASIGPARVYRSKIMVAPITIGVRTFIGNAALMPVGSNVPDGCLIGVQSTPPLAAIDPGSSWLDSECTCHEDRSLRTRRRADIQATSWILRITLRL